MAELVERGQVRRSGQWARLVEQSQEQDWDLWVSAPMHCSRQVLAVGVDRVEVEPEHTVLPRPTRHRQTTRPGATERGEGEYDDESQEQGQE